MEVKKLNKEKRVPKTEVKSDVVFTAEQKEAKELIKNNKVIVLYGEAGTAKTFCSVLSCVDLYFKREIEKIYIMRPAVAIEDLGFLKGTADDKLLPYMMPIYLNLYKAYGKAKIDKMKAEGIIEILPLAFIQGWTIDSVLIVDEAENLTESQLRMILNGDVAQIMLKDKAKSGFKKLLDLEGKIDNFVVKEMLTNYRHPFVKQIIKLY
jgi:phosphate starvation-inducible PhoH-like protein